MNTRLWQQWKWRQKWKREEKKWGVESVEQEKWCTNKKVTKKNLKRSLEKTYKDDY